MLTKIKSFFGSGDRSSPPRFKEESLNDEQRKSLLDQAASNQKYQEAKKEQEKLIETLQWAIHIDVDLLDDPEEKQMVEELQEMQLEKLKKGAETHAYRESRAFSSDITPNLLTSDDLLVVRGKRVFGFKANKK